MSERGETLEREPREQTVTESMMHLPCSRDCLASLAEFINSFTCSSCYVFSTAHGSREPRCRSAASVDPAPYFHYRQRGQPPIGGKPLHSGGKIPPRHAGKSFMTGTRCPVRQSRPMPLDESQTIGLQRGRRAQMVRRCQRVRADRRRCAGHSVPMPSAALAPARETGGSEGGRSTPAPTAMFNIRVVPVATKPPVTHWAGPAWRGASTGRF